MTNGALGMSTFASGSALTNVTWSPSFLIDAGSSTASAASSVILIESGTGLTEAVKSSGEEPVTRAIKSRWLRASSCGEPSATITPLSKTRMRWKYLSKCRWEFSATMRILSCSRCSTPCSKIQLPVLPSTAENGSSNRMIWERLADMKDRASDTRAF